jgi:hypothetical protein
VDAETDRATLPVNPVGAVIVSVQEPEPPAGIWGGETGPQITESWPKLKVIAAVVREREPLVPVTVTVKVPVAVELQLRVAVCGEVPKVTLAGKVHVSPAGVEADTDKATVPVNPLRAVTVIVDVPEAPGDIWAGETAPAAIVKSTTWKRIVAVV